METSWNITQSEYGDLLKELEQSISVDEKTDTAKKLGATVKWTYDGKTLTITSVKRSIYTPASIEQIETGIAKEIDAALEKMRNPA